MKKCLFDGCTNPVFSNLFCKFHQNKRTDNKAIEARNRPIEPRSSIKAHKHTTSDKSELKTTKSELMTMWGFNNQKEMFDFVWKTRKHICIFTGEDLNRVPFYMQHWCCMHILRKGSYPFFKFNPQNIVLGFPEFHTAADNFTEEERTKHPTWDFDLFFQMQEQQKQKYRDFLRSNLL